MGIQYSINIFIDYENDYCQFMVSVTNETLPTKDSTVYRYSSTIEPGIDPARIQDAFDRLDNAFSN